MALNRSRPLLALSLRFPNRTLTQTPILKSDRLLVTGLLWLTVSLGFASELKGFAQIPFSQALSFAALNWITWAIIGPFLFLVAQQFPIESSSLRRALPIQLLAALAALCIDFIWHQNIPFLFPTSFVPPPHFLPSPSPPSTSPGGEDPQSHNHDPRQKDPHQAPHPLLPHLVAIPLLLIIQTSAHAALFYRRATLRDREAIELERRLTEAKLQAITAQLHPHFLFNAINTAAGMIYEDPKLADKMLVAICDFLRETLARPLHQDISLEEEMELVRRFLLIQEIRFGNRLDVKIEIPAALWTAAVPALCLQPLVENAFKHGLEHITGPLKLSLRAAASAEMLSLEIADNGPGPATNPKENGHGLNNIRARLNAQFGANATLALRNENGCIAELRLPLRLL